MSGLLEYSFCVGVLLFLKQTKIVRGFGERQNNKGRQLRVLLNFVLCKLDQGCLSFFVQLYVIDEPYIILMAINLRRSHDSSVSSV